MTRHLPAVAAFAACCVLACPGLSSADDPVPRAADGTDDSERVFSFHIGVARSAEEPGVRPRQLAEDMEVFGALLKETLEQLYPAATAQANRRPRDVASIEYFEDSSTRWPGLELLAGGGPVASIEYFEDSSTVPPTTKMVVRGSEGAVARVIDAEKGRAEAVSDPVAMPLAGYGVVFTVTVPEPRPDESPAQAEEPADKPKEKCPYLQMDRWEQTRTRLELARNPRAYRCANCHSDVKRSLSDLGDDDQTILVPHPYFEFLRLDVTTLTGFNFQPSAGGPTKSELVDAVTGLLAETGRHIRLPADQRVAVVLRFREPRDTGVPRKAVRYVPVQRDGVVKYVPVPSVQFVPPLGVVPREFRDVTQTMMAAQVAREIAAGDAAMRERDSKEATEHYEKARQDVIGRLQELYDQGPKRSDEAVEDTQKALVRVLAKLSQAQGAAGDLEGQKETEKRLDRYPQAWQDDMDRSPAIDPLVGKGELAGDLLVKQHKHEEALANYEKALKSLLDGDGPKPRSNEELAAALRTPNVRSAFFRLLRKVAQAAVAAGALEQAAGPLALLGFENTAIDYVPLKAPPAPRRPHTLEISVTKKSLDAIGGGARTNGPPGAPVGIEKMTKDEFREAVTVREFAPRPEQDAPADAPAAGDPKKVEGVVTEVVDVAGRRFVELSVGADDGIRPGSRDWLVGIVHHHVGDRGVLQYVALARLLFTAADRSLALADNYRDKVRRGDHFSIDYEPEGVEEGDKEP